MQTHRLRRELFLPGLVAAALLVPRASYAHAVGISRGEYEVRGRTLTVVLLFARAELAAVVPQLDGDRDGLVSDREIRAAWPDLTDAIVRQIKIDDGAGGCAGTLEGAALAEGDGLSIRASYRCSSDSRALSVTLGFLDLMAHGHRHLAAVTSGDAGNRGGIVARSVAYSGHAQLQLNVISGRIWAMGLGRQAGGIFRLGVAHVLTAYDHLAFLLALMLVGGRPRPLLLALAAFTIGHCTALGLSVLGGLSPSVQLIGPAIALSVAYVGVENWFVTNDDGRWLVTFPFGLAHGFGFAGALQQISLAPPQLPLGLATFTGGVEAGQIAVVLIALPGLMLCRRQQWFADRGVKASSAAIAAAGLWWFVSRVA